MTATAASARAGPEALFLAMVRMRRVEEALAGLWERGLISGELHLGIGEEAIAAGVVAQLGEGDALATDHRSTPPLVGIGLELEPLILELLGSERGLCHGRGGHMHLLAPEHLAASSGIVGAAAPLATGFALAAERLRPGRVAVAFFGEGAMNQGMVLEALNLASAWRLPAVFVCKDSGFAISTRSRRVTAGSLATRAGGLGIPVRRASGASVAQVAQVAAAAVGRARARRGPTLIIARCHRPGGHFSGDPLLRALRSPLRADNREMVRELVAAGRRRPGAPALDRLAGLGAVAGSLGVFAGERARYRDPLAVARRRLPGAVARACEERAAEEVERAVAGALALEGVAA